MQRCTVSANRALTTGGSYSAGGGIFVTHSDLSLESSLVSDNSAFSDGGIVGGGSSAGGGIYSNISELELRHVTIANNRASASSAIGSRSFSQGGGLEVVGINGSCSIDSCIVTANRARTTASQLLVTSGAIEITFSNIRNAGSDIVGVTFVPGEDGNISSDPLFAPDFRLSNGSPSIDAGNPASRVTTDLDGAPRPGPGGPPDMGAYERDA